MDMNISRREFLKRSAVLGAGVAAGSAALSGRALPAGLARYRPPIDLAVAGGTSPARNCLAAVDALGGFGKFVQPGDKVVVKPNPIGSSPPEMAVNTHPEMVEAVVRECFAAGAGEVIVLSHDGMSSFTGNGTADAVERAGGTVKALQNRHEEFAEIPVPRGRVLRTVEIARDIIDADVFINMPIAKHHGQTRVTFAMKNLMGVNWDRIFFHRNDIERCIAELASAIPHSLVIMDANHVLLTNGPSGPGRVVRPQRVIAGIDPVAVDAYSTRFHEILPERIRHIREAYDLGVGEMHVENLRIEEVNA
ncbi:MAG: DUF362 domain-containing protein [Candidatus Eisenbacteria bacterium]|nr:DUF362 domain-containing protein [Candidatus Eisenbacteria bacterium]